MQRYSVFETAHGHCAIVWRGAGIAGFRLPGSLPAATERSLRERFPDATQDVPPASVKEVIAAARRYFDGGVEDFGRFVVDLGEQSSFFRDVYEFVRRLGFGETTTYGAVARALGTGPESARDVGQAMAKNPVPLIIPCHRVLAAGGKIGGFSAPGGSVAKARMLAIEGVTLEMPPKQQTFGF